MTQINQNSKIEIHYKLSLEDGQLIEDIYDEPALLCFIGDGTLCPGMEDALLDAKIGDTVQADITPETGYGYPDEENIHSVPLSDFDQDMDIEVGQVIAFDGPDDEQEITGTINEIKGDEVLVDFSHPLAGRHLKFKATVLNIDNS